MKEFFTQCLKDLEPLTGIRQLFFLESDLDDGKRKKDVLIDGMVAVCAQFPYIPEQAQQKWIRKMMVEDQNYEALSPRTILKWLTLLSNSYRTQGQSQDSRPTDSLTYYQSLTEDQKIIFKAEYEDLYGIGKGIFATEEQRSAPARKVKSRIEQLRDTIRGTNAATK